MRAEAHMRRDGNAMLTDVPKPKKQLAEGAKQKARALAAYTPPRLTSVAAARSTLSTPTPARPTTFKRPLLASNTARVICGGACSGAQQAGERAHAHNPSRKPALRWHRACSAYKELLCWRTQYACKA